MTKTKIRLTLPEVPGYFEYQVYIFGDYDNYHCVLETGTGEWVSSWDDGSTTDQARHRALSLAKDDMATRLARAANHKFLVEV